MSIALLGVFMWGRLFVLLFLHPIRAFERLFLPFAFILLLLFIVGRLRGRRTVEGVPVKRR